MAALVALIVAVGIYPSLIVDTLENGVTRTMGFL
jgi:NADH:ubiquinone oxidoreductase subunit 4 (subunit M)